MAIGLYTRAIVCGDSRFDWLIIFSMPSMNHIPSNQLATVVSRALIGYNFSRPLYSKYSNLSDECPYLF